MTEKGTVSKQLYNKGSQIKNLSGDERGSVGANQIL
jgi:hypothetical protein